MNLFHLRYFVTLAKSQNYTRAARQLNITQPSLSNAIHGLEAELGLALFVRQGRNVVLTSEGREFSRIVDHSLTILDSGIEQLQHQNNEQTVIKLAALRTLSTRWVPGMVREFLQNSQQDVRFEFTNENGLSPQIIQGLRAKHYDICFCSKVDEQEDIAYFPIASQALVVITPTDHPLATRNQIELSETLAFDQVTFSTVCTPLKRMKPSRVSLQTASASPLSPICHFLKRYPLKSFRLVFQLGSVFFIWQL